MAGINAVCISGNLTRDPELRATRGGSAVLDFCVAVNDRRRNQQTGEWEDHANYVNCSLYGKRAESLHRHMYKGQKVAVQGRLRYRSWTGEDGQKRDRLDVAVDEIAFLDGKGGGPAQQQPRPARPELYDSEIPF